MKVQMAHAQKTCTLSYHEIILKMHNTLRYAFYGRA